MHPYVFSFIVLAGLFSLLMSTCTFGCISSPAFIAFGELNETNVSLRLWLSVWFFKWSSSKFNFSLKVSLFEYRL